MKLITVMLLSCSMAFGQHVAASKIDVSNAGLFTNTQMNEFMQALIGGATASNEFSTVQGGNFATDALAGVVSMPVGATVHQADGVAGYCVSAAVSSPPGSKANCVGAYGQSRATANTTALWGGNFVCTDALGISSTTCIGTEIDTNIVGAPTQVWGLALNGILTGTMPAAPPVGSGEVFNAAAMMYLTIAGSSTQMWPAGIVFSKGAVNGPALQADAACTSGTCSSAWITLSGLNAGAPKPVTIQADSQGSMLLSAGAGGAVRFILHAFAALPTCNGTNEGSVAPVSDSNTNVWGATVANGGSNHILAYCDGTNWTVAAK